MRYQTLYPQPPGNGESDASIAFWLRKGHSAGKPLPQLAIREDANFFVQSWTKKLFFANKDPKTNFDDWMILQKHVLSFKCNDFFKMANLKAISSSATLTSHSSGGGHLLHCKWLSFVKWLFSVTPFLTWVVVNRKNSFFESLAGYLGPISLSVSQSCQQVYYGIQVYLFTWNYLQVIY